MPRVVVELAPAAAEVLRSQAGGDQRFATSTVKGAVAWAADALGDPDSLATVARASDLPALRAALAARPDTAAARIVDVRLGADPPHVVAELFPSGLRAVLKAVEYPNPGWRLTALAGPADDPVPAPLPERLVRFELPAAATGGHQLEWLIGALDGAAAVLGQRIVPGLMPDTQWSREDLGQGETRQIEFKAWEVGDVHVSVEVAEHEIFDGATPRWTYLHATATGLPGGAEVWVAGSIRVAAEPAGRLFLIGPRDLIDQVRAPE